MESQVKRAPKRLTCCSSGVVRVSMWRSIALMRPISVAPPVATTTPAPWPAVTRLPE